VFEDFYAAKVRQDGTPYGNKWRPSFEMWIEAKTAVALAAPTSAPMRFAVGVIRFILTNEQHQI